MRRLPLLLLMTLIAFTAACGGESTTADEGATVAVRLPPVPPCDLVTRNEIVSVLGVEPGEPLDPGPQGPMFQCIWESPGDDTAPYLHLVLLPAPATDLETFLAQARESIGEEAEAWTLEPVEGVGDFAVTMGPENYSVLQVVVGDRLLQVKTIEGNERTALENARSLAGIALLRLTGEEPLDEATAENATAAADEQAPPH